MPKKKGNGEGSVRKRSDGSWEARFSYLDAMGELKFKSFYGKQKKQAHDKMLRFQSLYNAGEPVSHEQHIKYKIKEWIPYFIFTFKLGKVEYTSAAAYASMYINHIEPALGEYFIDNLQPITIQGLVNSLDTSKSTRTAEYVMVVLKEAYKIANQFHYTKNNPTEHIVLPKKKAQESTPLTTKHQELYISKIPELDPISQLILYMPLATGVGPGELLAIRKEDLDFESRKIAIKNALKESEKGDKIGKTKTKYRVRHTPMNDRLYEMLLPYKEQVGFLFEGRIKGQPLNLKYPSKLFRSYADDLGLFDYTYYDLRHTFATRCRQKGLRKKLVQSIMGHGSSKMLDKVYEHEDEEEIFESELKKLSDIF